jgi:hypothetical protein
MLFVNLEHVNVILVMLFVNLRHVNVIFVMYENLRHISVIFVMSLFGDILLQIYSHVYAQLRRIL